MHVALVAGTNLDRLHPARFLNRHRENEIPIGVGALRRQSQRLVRSENQIGLAQSPALDKLRRRRKIRRIALDRSLLDPAPDQLDFSIGQAKLIRKFQLLRLRQPRRHGSRPRHVGDLSRMLLDVGVGQQRKRRRFSRPVTRAARTKNDRSDVAIEGDLRRAAGTSAEDDWPSGQAYPPRLRRPAEAASMPRREAESLFQVRDVASHSPDFAPGHGLAR